MRALAFRSVLIASSFMAVTAWLQDIPLNQQALLSAASIVVAVTAFCFLYRD